MLSVHLLGNRPFYTTRLTRPHSSQANFLLLLGLVLVYTNTKLLSPQARPHSVRSYSLALHTSKKER